MRSIFIAIFFVLASGVGVVNAQDVEGAEDHPAITRYPESIITWYKVENYLPYKMAVGQVTGYQKIDEWVETQGRVTRLFYELDGTRTHSEVYLNYREALEAAGFDILGDGLFAERNTKKTVGGYGWMKVAWAPNPYPQGPATKLFRGTASAGGTGALVASKERAAGKIYINIALRQFDSDTVIIAVDVIEEKAAETGLVIVDAEAMGKDITEYGRVVLEGLLFDHDKATLRAESKPALEEIVKFLKAQPDTNFYVVGHTDSVGTFAYNQKLSADRARSVVDVLVRDYNIAEGRLEPHGVGPLNPVFSNASDAGKDKNRRVELVER